MAKLVGLIGTGSGRVGNMVLAKRDGLTIARAYQPQVANPSTVAQMNQRAKFALLTKESSVLAPVLYPLAKKGISARNAFMRLHMGSVVVTNTGEPFSASLLDSAITLTGKNKPMGGTIDIAIDGAQGSLAMNVLAEYAGGSVVAAEVATSANGIQLYSVSRIPIPADIDTPIYALTGTVNNVSGNSAKYLVFIEAPTNEKAAAEYQTLLVGNNSNETMQLFERLVRNEGLTFSRTALV